MPLARRALSCVNVSPAARWVRMFGAFLLVVGLLAPIAAAQSAADELRAQARSVLAPLDGQLTIRGLREPVEIVRDRWGIAHIYAGNQHDLFFAQGFVAAQDRLFQLELWRRTGRGEMAELLGPEFVEGDRFARLLLYRGDMQAEWNSYSADTREIVAAFVGGINAQIQQCGERLPIEFQVLRLRPVPWTPTDVLTRMSGIVMCGNWQREIARARLIAAVGAETARRLAPTDPPRPFALAPEIDPVAISADIAQGYVLASRTPVLRPPASESNNWVVDSSLSESGQPLLAGDPHRTIAIPSLRYLVHLHAPGWNVIGSGEPALPGVAIGHNEQIAWAFTIVGTDQADLYVEQTKVGDPEKYLVGEVWADMQVIHDVIRVRGRQEPLPVELRYTDHGPVLSQDAARNRAFVLKWVGAQPGGAAYLGSLALDRANNRRQFLDALRAWKVPALNFVYADRDGHIGWIAAGLTPIRTQGDGLLPVPGAARVYEWKSRFLDVADYPQRWDPAEHWLATANHNITPAGYDHLIAYDFEMPFRFERIRSQLANPPRANGKFNLDDFRRIQQDVTSLAARSLVNVLRGSELPPPLRDAARLLTEWDGELTVGSPAAALYGHWVQEVENAFYAERIPSDPKLERGALRRLSLVIEQLTKPDAWWWGPQPAQARDRFLAATLGRAAERTRARLGDDPQRWRWGDVHTVTFGHPLAGLGPAQAEVFNLKPLPRPGDSTTPNNTRANDQLEQVHGASYRQLFDLADWDRGLATSAPGQSGQPGSPHYADLAPLWADGQYFPLAFSRPKVESVQAHRLVLEPARP